MGIPVSDPKNISKMKIALALFVVLACVLVESEAQLNYFYKSRAAVNGALGFPSAYGGNFGYSGYRGYRGYGGYRGYYRGKRSADGEHQAAYEPPFAPPKYEQFYPDYQPTSFTADY